MGKGKGVLKRENREEEKVLKGGNGERVKGSEIGKCGKGKVFKWEKGKRFLRVGMGKGENLLKGKNGKWGKSS